MQREGPSLENTAQSVPHLPGLFPFLLFPLDFTEFAETLFEIFKMSREKKVTQL